MAQASKSPLKSSPMKSNLLLLVVTWSALSNIQGERREAAAADVRFGSDPDGCLPFAPPCGFDNLSLRRSFGSLKPRITHATAWTALNAPRKHRTETPKMIPQTLTE